VFRIMRATKEEKKASAAPREGGGARLGLEVKRERDERRESDDGGATDARDARERPTREVGLARLLRHGLQEAGAAHLSQPGPEVSLATQEGRVGQPEGVGHARFPRDVGGEDLFRAGRAEDRTRHVGREEEERQVRGGPGLRVGEDGRDVECVDAGLVERDDRGSSSSRRGSCSSGRRRR
jgi:hypothetical protein